MTGGDASGRGQRWRTRRAFVGTLGATLAAGAVGAVAGQESVAETFELDGSTSGWVGQSPASIQGVTNPTLDLVAGETYEVVWTNADGDLHDFQLRDAAGTVLEETEDVSTQGESASVTFSATESTATYVCSYHLNSMVGDVAVEAASTPTPAPTPTPTDQGTPTDGQSPTPTPTDAQPTTPTPTPGGGSPGDLGQPASAVTVAMESALEGHVFSPVVVHVEVGGTVTWELIGGTHTATAYHPDAYGEQRRVPEGTDPWDSGSLSTEGATFEHTFDRAGVYDYICVPHASQGMVGTVVVGWPDPDGEAGLEPPGESVPAAAAAEYESTNPTVRSVLADGPRQACLEVTDGHLACDLDADGRFRDVDGDGDVDFDDVRELFDHITHPGVTDNADAFDLNGNARVDSDDVVTLYEGL